jgi:hypothetical protein
MIPLVYILGTKEENENTGEDCRNPRRNMR